MHMHMCTYTHTHTQPPWMRVSAAIYSHHLQSRKILSAFSYESCFDRFLIELFSVFALVFVSLYLNMPPRLLFSSHCFCSLWWIICFTGRLFCVISPYSTSHLLSFHYRHLFDTVCLPRLWIKHTVILSASTHLSGGKRQKMVLFSTSSSYFYCCNRQHSESVYHRAYSQSKRIRFQTAGVYSAGTVHSYSRAQQSNRSCIWMTLSSLPKPQWQVATC